MKKAGTSGTTVKSGNIGKITSKSGSANVGKTSKNSSNSPSLGKLPNVPTKPSTKSYEFSSYTPQKNKRTFGIIWLPTKKKNKYKDEVYNSHKLDRSHERAPSMYNNLISGAMDPLDKKGETSHQEGERSGIVPLTVAGGAAVAELPDIDANQEEDEILKHDWEESKEGGGDVHDISKNTDKDYLENNQKEKDIAKNSEKEKGDNVDSVFLRSPPPHKVTSNTSNSTNTEEDCGITCLYFALKCCECSIV